MTNQWEAVTPPQLRIAAIVARASGSLQLCAAADAWERRASEMDGR